MTVSPLQLAVYKGMGGRNGAVQFGVQEPHWYVRRGDTLLRNYDGRWIKDEWLKDFPDLTAKDLTSREGAVFLTIASATGKNEYNWKEKITVALSITDLSKLLLVLEGKAPEVKLMHDPGAKSDAQGQVHKYCTFRSPEGIKTGVLIEVAESMKGGDTVRHMVPLNQDETLLLAVCFRAVIPKCLGWA